MSGQVDAASVDAGHWEGIVRIERPKGANAQSACRIISARILGLDGRRAISTSAPYHAVRHHFKAGDPDFVSIHAEFRHGYLELRERAKPSDFFLHIVPQ